MRGKKKIEQGEVHIQGDVLVALKSCAPSQIEELFMDLKVAACLRLPSCKDDDARRELQAEVTAIDRIKQYFLDEIQR